jgi:hypothetical protein
MEPQDVAMAPRDVATAQTLATVLISAAVALSGENATATTENVILTCI